MTRRIAPLSLTAALALMMVGGLAPAGAQELGAPFLTIDAAPDGAAVAVGERFTGTEFDNTRRVAAGPVGSVPVFVADDEFGCLWGTASASGVEEWIGVARRGMTEADPDTVDRCPGFQTKVTLATAAGADALIVVNHSAGHEAGLAAGEIPGMMIDRAEGDRLIESLDAANPDAVKATLESLDPNTFLPPAPVSPTTLQSLSATGGGSSVSVTGRAFFGGHAVSVGTDPEGDVPFPAVLGYDLVEASVSQMGPSDGDVRFTFDLADLPATGGLPEAARYIWDFGLNVPGQQPVLLSVEGKLTDVARRNTERTPAFYLRGNCVTENNVTTCEDVAELSAVMDGAMNTITATVPLQVLEEEAGASLAGATIGQATICEGISTKASAYFSACGGAVGPQTGDVLIADNDPYYSLASPSVEIGIVPAGADPVFTQDATIGSGGNFSGTLDTSGLAPGTYDVHARACYGSNCATRTTTITI